MAYSYNNTGEHTGGPPWNSGNTYEVSSSNQMYQNDEDDENPPPQKITDFLPNSNNAGKGRDEDEEDAGEAGFCTRQRIFFGFLSAGFLGCLAFTLLAWFGGRIIYAYGGAWHSFLACFCFLAVLTDLNFYRGTLVLYHKHNIFTTALCTLALLSTIIGLVFILTSDYGVNTADAIAKPVFMVVSILALLSFFVTSLALHRADPDFEDLGERSDRSLEKFRQEVTLCGKIKSGCRECGLVTLFALFILASAYSAYWVLEAAEFSPQGTGELLVSLDLPNDDGESLKQFVRCEGENDLGHPTVIFWHGWSGQSLDFIWIFRELAAVTKVCSFDRLGYGQSTLNLVEGIKPRTSQEIAVEAMEMLTGIGETSDLLFVGHSMAGFNMRAFDALFPGVVKAMVFLDAVNPDFTDDCDPDKTYSAAFYYYLGERMVDSGLLSILQTFGTFDSFAPISSLPSDVQAEYVADVFRKEWFTTTVEERKAWGKSCNFVKENSLTLNFPINVIVAENGIWKGELFKGLELSDLSNSTLSTQSTVAGAEHAGLLFKQEFADIVAASIVNFITAIST